MTGFLVFGFLSCFLIAAAAAQPRRCVFIHGAGYNHTAPASPVDIGSYWGGASNVAAFVGKACKSITFLHHDMLGTGWDDAMLQAKVCGELTSAPSGIIRGTIVISHSMGNLVFADALRKGVCTLDHETSRWVTMSAPWKGSKAADWVGNICANPYSPLHYLSERLHYCNKETGKLYPSWEALQTTHPDLISAKLRTQVQGNISASLCGESAFGILSKFSAELEALAVAVHYGEKNDAMVAVSSCMIPSLDYMKHWKSINYLAQINHADGTLRNADGKSDRKKPGMWLRTVLAGVFARFTGSGIKLRLPQLGDTSNPSTSMQTPLMGWRSWNTFYLSIDQQKIVGQAHAMVQKYAAPQATASTVTEATSLSELGYKNVGIDDGWQACGEGSNGSFHNASGWPLVNKNRFPDIAAMNAVIRRMGLNSGFYFNNCWCNERNVNGGAHAEQDVAAAAKWGFATLKVDGCGPAHDFDVWVSAAKKYDIMLENCGDNPRSPGSPPLPRPMPQQWATPTIEHLRKLILSGKCVYGMYRTSTDIAADFFSAMYNLQATAPYLAASVSQPGCYAYPDMLMVGDPRMTKVEWRTHFAAWCIVSSPLVLGFDLEDSERRADVWPIISNRRAIRVNQHWAGHAGSLVSASHDTFEKVVFHGAEHVKDNEPTTFPRWQVWAKPLSRDGSEVAVLLINLGGDTLEESVSVSWKDLGFAGRNRSHFSVTDVWNGVTRSSASNSRAFTFRGNLAGHDSAFLILSSS